MTYPDPSQARRKVRLLRVSRDTWFALALVGGAVPWVTAAIMLLWS